MSVAFHPSGDLIAVGTQDGSVVILNAAKGHQMMSKQLTQPNPKNKIPSAGGSNLMSDSIDCMKYSPGSLGCFFGG